MRTSSEATSTEAFALFRRVLLIRLVEEKIARVYPEWKIRCPIHLGIGHEAPAALVCSRLGTGDLVYAGHRSHAAYLAKGGSVVSLFAELLGKTGGCSHGHGGSMHLIDRERGFLGSTSIVAGTIPVATGSALRLRQDSARRVVACFFGDAAVEEGVFFESLVFASKHGLPVIYCIEDNGYACFTKTSARRGAIDFEKLCSSLGIGYLGLANPNPLRNAVPIARAISAVRKKPAPLLMHFPVFRRYEHCGPFIDDELGYRDSLEVKEWRRRDPLVNVERELHKAGFGQRMSRLRDRLAREIDRAYIRALEMKDQTSLFESSGVPR